MNTRQTVRPTTIRFRPVSRAEFSPIGSLKRRSSAESVPPTGADNLNATAVPKEPTFGLEPAWPAWHRGPLDRLQPVLTRYRD